ncbi:uncharacterized protein [Miscanthus floridulus]|uniref:uncharacterized protein n=1 Tax=Miscanthus floridulus TaxID=154761 RepID=UPI0034587EB7
MGETLASAMAPPVALLQVPNPSGDCLDPGLASAPVTERRPPIGKAIRVKYSDVVDENYPIDYEITCPGQSFTLRQEKEIRLNSMNRMAHLWEQFSDSCNERDENTPVAPGPLRVLPVTTYSCITRGFCYHREYMTTDTSQTKSILGFREPQQMMQIFSLRLSSYKSKSYPISIYGTFAVRDDLEPLRNYVFNRSRDNPVMIYQESEDLPLCSPCRGIYVLDRALLEVDLWVKKEEEGSTDERLLSEYVEICLRSSFNKMRTGRIHSEDAILDMDFMFLSESVEAVIEVFTGVDSPPHVRFIASSSCFDKEILLFEGKCFQGKLFTHVVAVTVEEKLSIHLEWENPHLEWTFQDGVVGALSYPDDDSVPFYVRVFFAPKNLGRRPSRYDAWKKRCKNKGTTSSGLLKV